MLKPSPSEIKQARMDAGLTLKQSAEFVGVALRTWQHWETGDRKMSASAWELFKLKIPAKTAA